MQKEVRKAQAESNDKSITINELQLKLTNLQKSFEQKEALHSQSIQMQETNSQLLEEIHAIHDRLNNVNFEDLDERSEIFSQVKSQIL